MIYNKNYSKLIILLFCSLIIFMDCNYNPLGGSRSQIDSGNGPFLNIPKIFDFTSVVKGIEKVTLTWQIAVGADFYTVWYGTISGNYTNSLSGCTALTPCVINGLANGMSYYFKVTATNLFGSRDSNSEVAATPNYAFVNAYIMDRTLDQISICSIGVTTKTINSCYAIACPLGCSAPFGTEIFNGRLYISSAADNAIYQCDLDTNTGAIINSSCFSNAGIFNFPVGITAYNNKMYVSNTNGNTVYSCSINTISGTLSGCVITGNGYNQPLTTVFYNGFAYISSFNSNIILLCNISSGGNLTGCSQTPAGVNFNRPMGMQIYNGYIYIASFSSSLIYVCKINSDGTLNNCNPTGTGFVSPRFISSYNGNIYVSGFSSNIRQCNINADGSLSACFDVINAVFSNPMEGIILKGF